MAQKKQKTKNIRGHGHLVTSNVNSENSQCITLTYSVSRIKSMKDVLPIERELSDLVDEDIGFDLEVKGHNSEEQEIKIKAKIKTCDDEDKGHLISEIFDKHIKKKGGQTTLDEGSNGGDE